jgi:hypothetical protein
MATITYEAEAERHLQRGMMYRHRRMQRWQPLHEHDGCATFWRIAIPSLLIFWALVAYGINSI